jgi:hypothetical protein
MIELKPKIENCFSCPECKSEVPAINQVLIHSVHAMADCTCTQCNLQFYQIFPVGHNVEDQLSISKTNSKFYDNAGTESWLFDSLVKAHEGVRKEEVKIEKVVFKNYEEVVILNTLDYLYGHVLLKLYNCFYHLDHQKNLGLVLIIPKMFEWLIPVGCAEAWIVDLKLSELAYGYESIQKFVSQQFARFRSIYLSKAYSHPDFTTIDIFRLTGVRPFDLSTFKERKPAVTFVLREDRWWLTTVADYWFFRICRKLKILSWGARVLSGRQNRLVKQTIKHIKKKLGEADLYIVGLGRTGTFNGYGVDERRAKIDASVETAWCGMYAKSHVVVGIHGSNMLLPTALAAGCVEILPQERYGNMVQDISVRYNDRRQLFFYRFADQFASPRSVAEKVVGIVEHYDAYHKNMCRNLYVS